MRQLLRSFSLLVLSLALCLPPPVAAQRAENLSEEALSKLSDLQSAAEQFAEQAGKFSGRKIGPKLGSASNSLMQILTNFDIWACGTMVLGLSLKHRRLAVEAAAAQPPDPALDQAVVDFGNLIAQLQELCNRHVYDAGLAPRPTAVATGTDAAPAPAPAPDPEPRRPVDERICQQKCGELYAAYLRAEREYEREKRTAETWRADAQRARTAAEAAAERARAADARAEESQRKVNELQAQLTAATDTPTRLRIAEELSHLNPSGLREDAAKAHEEAAKAEERAKSEEGHAARQARKASMAYDAMIEIYEAWLKCARDCAKMAKDARGTVIRIDDLFPLAPETAPARPDFYTAPPAVVVPAPANVAPQPVSYRVVATPMALSGGVLMGAVYDNQGEPKEETRVALTEPDGSQTSVTTDESGRFAIAIGEEIGQAALALPGLSAQPRNFQIVGEVPTGLTGAMPQFVGIGDPVVLGEPYTAVSVTTGTGAEFELPHATSIGADGVTGITSFAIPSLVGTGPFTVNLIGLDGTQVAQESGAYGFLEAWLEQDKLRSGQSAGFGYVIDFGDGPMTIVMTINTTGPIVYDKVGVPQVIQIGADGQMRFQGTIRALQGSPTGIPFTIVPTFVREGDPPTEALTL